MRAQIMKVYVVVLDLMRIPNTIMHVVHVRYVLPCTPRMHARIAYCHVCMYAFIYIYRGNVHIYRYMGTYIHEKIR